MVNYRSEFEEILQIRNDMLHKQKELYISSIARLNYRTRELLQNDFGSTLVKNCARDAAGEAVRRFFDTGDYYITVDQMYNRIVHFSYENDIDVLYGDDAIKKMIYNQSDSPLMSSTLREISAQSHEAQQKLFEENRAQDKLDKRGKEAYRKQSEGRMVDELTGKEGKVRTITRNGKEVDVSDLHADHIQARASATYNERYMRQGKVEKLREFYNSPDNFQLIHASANSSKGDVRVCEVNGKIKYMTTKDSDYKPEQDITYKATPEQMVEATVHQWEKETPSSSKTYILKEKGYLDENGKVKESVKKELELKFRHSQNKESMVKLKTADYGEVAADAARKTKASIGKIISGQIIYYVLPPVVFETQTLISQKGMTIDRFLREIKKSGKRVIRYVVSKLGETFKNVGNNFFNKFLKTFFDILIEMVKATVKKLLTIVKQLVMSLVSCLKILVDQKSTAAQKADAITKTLSVTVTAIVMELLFEYIQKQFNLPDILIEPLQMIVTILATNIIMLVLQKADLFDVQYGLLVANIERVFEEERDLFIAESDALLEEHSERIKQRLHHIELQILDIQESLDQIDLYSTEVAPELEELNRLFNMQIHFDEEWNTFIARS